MYKYQITAMVNSHRTETVIVANSETAARKLFEAQYNGSKIQYISVKNLGR